MSKGFFKSIFGRNQNDDSAHDRPDAPPPDSGPEPEAGTPPIDQSAVDEVPVDASVADPSDDDGYAPELVQDLAPDLAANTAPEAGPSAADGAAPTRKPGWLSRLREGLSKSSTRLSEGVAAIITKRKLDDDTLEELEDLLITADLGADVARQMTEHLRRTRFSKEVSDTEIRTALADFIGEIMKAAEQPLAITGASRPHVILMTGVNGAGKTTTIGKLAARFRAEGKSVMLAAGDTFRAAAIEQLQAWGERTQTPVMVSKVGADAAGLAFDAIKKAQAENVDVLMIDTAGRLQNRRELMDELAKIVRVIRKVMPEAPHDTLLVLDATVGQNALSQTATFKEIADISGLVMTKLDGTARGGILVALTERFGLPVHFIGVGEGVDDLQPFNARAYVNALAGLSA